MGPSVNMTDTGSDIGEKSMARAAMVGRRVTRYKKDKVGAVRGCGVQAVCILIRTARLGGSVGQKGGEGEGQDSSWCGEDSVRNQDIGSNETVETKEVSSQESWGCSIYYS